LEFPLENARATRRGFSFGDLSGGLKGDGERSVCEGIVWREHGESKRGGNGLLELAGVTQGAYQAVMGLDACGVDGDGLAEGERRLRGCSVGEEIEAAFTKCGCANRVSVVHSYDKDNDYRCVGGEGGGSLLPTAGNCARSS
jgi:hypothetical protein